MRTLPFVALLFATTIAAQSPLTTTYANNNGGSTSGTVYFDLDVTDPAGITITALDINTSMTQSGLTLDVWTIAGSYVPNAGTQSAWTLSASGAMDGQGNGIPSSTCLGPGFYLLPGQYGVALQGTGIDHNYTGTGGTVGTLQIVYSTNELTLTAGAASNTPFGGSQFYPRVFNGSIYYNVGPVAGSGCAYSSTFGQGCYSGTTTYYESFAGLQSFDFVGSVGAEQVIEANSLGAQGYAVVAASTAWYTPTGTQVLNNAATPAAMGDDHFSQPLTLPFTFSFPGGSTNVIHAATNGYVQLATTTSNSSDFTPTAAELVSQPPRLCALWCDLQAATNVTTNPQSGVYFDVDPSGQTVYVTWLDVADRRGAAPAAGSTSVNVQCVLHASGSYAFRYGPIVPRVGGTGVVFTGWSQGNVTGVNAIDPGSVDLSASLPLITDGPDSIPLTHSVGVPRLGTNLDLLVANAENVAPIAILIAGDTAFQPGIDLTALGAPGCEGYVNILASAAVTLTFPGGTGSLALPIPNMPSLSGATFTSQYAALTLQNTLGLVTSNGAQWTLGN